MSILLISRFQGKELLQLWQKWEIFTQYLVLLYSSSTMLNNNSLAVMCYSSTEWMNKFHSMGRWVYLVTERWWRRRQRTSKRKVLSVSKRLQKTEKQQELFNSYIVIHIVMVQLRYGDSACSIIHISLELNWLAKKMYLKGKFNLNLEWFLWLNLRILCKY